MDTSLTTGARNYTMKITDNIEEVAWALAEYFAVAAFVVGGMILVFMP